MIASKSLIEGKIECTLQSKNISWLQNPDKTPAMI
jgi:hypothetical protein